MRRILAAATLSLLGCLNLAPSALAFSTPYMAPPNFTVPGMMYPMVTNPCPGGQCSGGGGGGNTHRSAPHVRVQTGFVPNAALRQQIRDGFIAEAQQRDPATAQGVAQLFASHDFIAEFARSHANLGLRANDVADVYAAFWLECWQVANQSTQPISRAEAQAVRAQVMNLMIPKAAGKLASAATRQEFAETFIYRTMLIAVGIDAARAQNQDTMVQAYSDQADSAMSGIDQRRLALTNAGFKVKN